MNRKIFLLVLLILSAMRSFAQQTIYQYLSGKDVEHTVNWDFFINTGMNSGKWKQIAVPSNWEQQGFGTYNYYTDKNNPTEEGLYKYKFRTPLVTPLKRVFLVFEGVMTDTEVKVNGEIAGPVHQGGYYRFNYDITHKLKKSGLNILEVSVRKKSSNLSVNRAEREADFWQFGGIFRPVYLEIVPEKHIERIAVDCREGGKMNLQVFLEPSSSAQQLFIELQTLSGENLKSFSVPASSEGNSIIEHQFNGIKNWNPESPNLYKLKITLKGEGKVQHIIQQRIGFRTVELRPGDGIYVNHVKVIFKGINRHSFSPETGRALSKRISVSDVKLIREMNMNAVRMSHYPPDQHFLDVCDSLGLFVINELSGWQKSYDTEVGRRLVKETVIRDVNHPSVVMWANGNEGGWNRELDDEFDRYDPQKRIVIHPWEKFRGTDTRHYPDYNYMVNAMLYGKEVFFPTEFMHGNYDGGMAAGLQDFWDMMLKHPAGAGGFLWSFADEGIARTDQHGRIDTSHDDAPDGIVGPHREKEGSFQAVRKIWSPIVIKNQIIPPDFDGFLTLENKYLYTNLSACYFSWKLLSYTKPGDSLGIRVNSSGEVISPEIGPGETAHLKLGLPSNWLQNEALSFTAFDQHHQEIYTWVWAIKSPEQLSLSDLKSVVVPKDVVTITDSLSSLTVHQGAIHVRFDQHTGLLDKVFNHGKIISLSRGPILAQARETMKLVNFKHYFHGEELIVESNYDGKERMNVKWIFAPGSVLRMEYSYSENGYDQQIGYDYMGITFNYPEKLVTGVKWLGNGPERVYKNRLAGAEFGLWHKFYNNTITGENWNYPEFKGYHGEVFWVRIENKESPFTIYTQDKGVYLQLFKPSDSKFARKTLTVPYPKGDIGFMNGIPPIGTKFQSANLLGPASQQNIQLNYTTKKGTLWFDFN